MKKLIGFGLVLVAATSIAHAAPPACGSGVQQNCTYTDPSGTKYMCEVWLQQDLALGQSFDTCVYANGITGGFHG
ncbi:MAG: hypothetical protein ACYDCC_10230 [Actinomycetota bacterium]